MKGKVRGWVAVIPFAALAVMMTWGRQTDGRPACPPPLPVEGSEWKVDLGPGVGFELLPIPAGDFDMGSPTAEAQGRPDEQSHRVSIRKPFWLAKTETTQAVWLYVMGQNPSENPGPANPVERVSWDDCHKFLRRLNVLLPGRGFRLPTEAEWEYACRAGSSSSWSCGEDRTQLGECAWFFANSEGKSHPVATKKPNVWGLFDMHGNVFEWCDDLYHDSYRGAPADGASWTADGPMAGRVHRGGGFGNIDRECRAAFRDRLHPALRTGSLGFRIATSAP